MHQVDYVIFRPYLFLCLSLSMYLSSVSGRLSITCCDLPTGGNASPFRESNIISCCMVGRGNKTHTYNIISGFVEHTLIRRVHRGTETFYEGGTIGRHLSL